jgi:hypothetical protein
MPNLKLSRKAKADLIDDAVTCNRNAPQALRS